MKAPLGLSIFLAACLALPGCGDDSRVNGHNLKTAFRSVDRMKERLPVEVRAEFETAYAALRNQFQDDEAFLHAVDQKDATEIITLGREFFAKNKAAGGAETAGYESWAQMVAARAGQRREQEPAANPPAAPDAGARPPGT